MTEIQLEQVPMSYYVRDGKGKMQGTIKGAPDGWRYSVKRSKVWSAPYESLSDLKAAVESDTVTAAAAA